MIYLCGVAENQSWWSVSDDQMSVNVSTGTAKRSPSGRVALALVKGLFMYYSLKVLTGTHNND